MQTSYWWQITRKIKKSFTAVARQTMAMTIDGAADDYHVNLVPIRIVKVVKMGHLIMEQCYP